MKRIPAKLAAGISKDTKTKLNLSVKEKRYGEKVWKIEKTKIPNKTNFGLRTLTLGKSFSLEIKLIIKEIKPITIKLIFVEKGPAESKAKGKTMLSTPRTEVRYIKYLYGSIFIELNCCFNWSSTNRFSCIFNIS